MTGLLACKKLSGAIVPEDSA